jgi:hypothetical protein
MTLDNRRITGNHTVRAIDWEWLESTRRVESSSFHRVELEQLTSGKLTPVTETVDTSTPKSSLFYSLPAARGSSSRDLHKRWFAKDTDVREAWHDRVTESLEVSELLSRCPVQITEDFEDTTIPTFKLAGAPIIGFDQSFASFDASPVTQDEYSEAIPLLTPTHNFILLSREFASSENLEPVASPSFNDEVDSVPLHVATENEQMKHELIQLEQAVTRKGGRKKRERGRNKKSKTKGNLSPVKSNTNFSPSEALLIAK